MTEDTELRLAALEHASRINNSRPTNAQTIVADAEVIYAFLKSRGITSQIPDVTISTIPHRSPSASNLGVSCSCGMVGLADQYAKMAFSISGDSSRYLHTKQRCGEVCDHGTFITDACPFTACGVG
jgi:hypothetical protein